MRIVFILAWRNLWRNKRRTLITVASVFFAVIMAITAQSFQKGSYELMIDNMVKYSTGYLQIQDVLFEDEPSMDNSMLYDAALKHSLKPFSSKIAYTVPRMQSFALAATNNTTRGVVVTGIDPDSENRFNNLTGLITEGDFIHAEDNAVLVAQGLAGMLQVKTGDTLVLISQGYQGTMAAGKFPVKGIIKLRVPELNNRSVYMPLEAARVFYSAEERLTSLIVMPVNPEDTEELAAEIESAVDKEWYRVLTWKVMLKDLLRLMEFDVAGNMVIIYILYIVIAFGIFGTVLTMMVERSKEFGMLISLGMKRKQLALICLLESLLMSFIGAVAGAASALPVVLWYHYNPIRLEGEMAEMILQYGFEPIMPFSLDPAIFMTQAWVVFGIAVIIGMYPVYKIFKLRIVDASKK
ncbi:MAG: FtsX-like permease family protein [Lentimicrobium sp.]|nr:FtsX-like permease family protein [Lentimicrobium sp.]